MLNMISMGLNKNSQSINFINKVTIFIIPENWRMWIKDGWPLLRVGQLWQLSLRRRNTAKRSAHFDQHFGIAVNHERGVISQWAYQQAVRLTKIQVPTRALGGVRYSYLQGKEHQAQGNSQEPQWNNCQKLYIFIIISANIMNLCFAMADDNGNWISLNRVGDPMLKGKTEV